MQETNARLARRTRMAYTHRYAEREPERGDVDALPGITVLEFGAPWCPHCIGAQPLIEAALAGRDDVRHLKIEDGPGRPLGRSYRIKLWPSVLVLRDGEERARAVRPTTREELVRALAEV
jgi:thioredoxin 1